MSRALALLPIALMACASDPPRELVARVAVQYATLKAIDGDAERAATVASVAKSAIRLASETTVDLPTLEAHVRDAIPWESLDLADRQLAELLILTVRGELQARLGPGAGQIPPDQVGAAVEVLSWVHEAALAAAAEPA